MDSDTCSLGSCAAMSGKSQADGRFIMIVLFFLICLGYIAYASPFIGGEINGQYAAAINMSAVTDIFFYDGDMIPIVANYTNLSDGQGHDNLQSVIGNFAQVGGSPNRNSIGLGGGSGIYTLNDTVNFSSVPFPIAGIMPINVYVNASNGTGWVNATVTAILVNMSTIPSCPPNNAMLPPLAPLSNWTMVGPIAGCNSTCNHDEGPAKWNGTHYVLCGPNFAGDTTNFSDIAKNGNFYSVPLVLDIPGKAKINFTTPVDMGTEPKMQSIFEFAIKLLSSGGKIGFNSSEYNGSNQYKPNLNLSAEITIYNITGLLGIANMPSIGYQQIYTPNGSAPSIVCPSSICSPENIAWDGENITFTVTHFSTYVIGPANYTLTFNNLSSTTLYVDPDVSATYILKVTNYGNTTETYNMSVNGTGTVNVTQITLNPDESTTVLLNVSNSTNGTYYSNVTGTLSTDSSIIMNSHDDIGDIVTIVGNDISPLFSGYVRYLNGAGVDNYTLRLESAANMSIWSQTSTIPIGYYEFLSACEGLYRLMEWSGPDSNRMDIEISNVTYIGNHYKDNFINISGKTELNITIYNITVNTTVNDLNDSYYREDLVEVTVNATNHENQAVNLTFLLNLMETGGPNGPQSINLSEQIIEITSGSTETRTLNVVIPDNCTGSIDVNTGVYDSSNYTYTNGNISVEISYMNFKMINVNEALINVSLIYPNDGMTVQTSNFTINYSTNINANCISYWNESGVWDVLINSNDTQQVGAAVSPPDGMYIWNVYCVDANNASNFAWGDESKNWTFIVNGSGAAENASETMVIVDKTVLNEGNIYIDDIVQYLINITNIGTTNISNISITDNYDIDLNYTIASIPPNDVNYTARKINWSNILIEDIQPNSSFFIYVNFSAILEAPSVSNMVNITAIDEFGSITTDSCTKIISIYNNTQIPINVSLIYPNNGDTLNVQENNFDFSVNVLANCSLYTNETGTWGSDKLKTDVQGNLYFTDTMIDGTYIWNVYCVDAYNESNSAWGNNRTFTINITGGGGPGDKINVTLTYPEDGFTFGKNFISLNFTANKTSDCLQYWNETGYWEKNMMFPEAIQASEGVNAYLNFVVPNGVYLWNIYCFTGDMYDPTDSGWAENNLTFTVDGSMPNCMNLNSTACNETANCTWEDFMQGCIIDCFQFDAESGGNNETCENAFDGGMCMWDYNLGYCDPFFFDKGWDGFSPCFEYEGNKTGCNEVAESLGCIWFSDPYGPIVEGENESGHCNPNNMDFGGQHECPQYDGNKTGCEYAKQTLGWTCEWNSDPWGPLFDGTEAGWCNNMMGGIMGCWGYADTESCNNAGTMGMPCIWKEGMSAGFCEEKGCWNYPSSGDCADHADEGCLWNDEFNYCYEVNCWDMDNETTCNNAEGIECTWYNDTYSDSGWCEEDGCFKRDWTNDTYCEAKDGCIWDEGSHMCNKKGCWYYDSSGSEVCNNNTLTGLKCQWKDNSMGWCEQKGCWDYDWTNETACVNDTASLGMNCLWDPMGQMCYQNFGGCEDHNNDEFGCYNTGYCMWNASSSNCTEPDFGVGGPKEFINPGCWAFTQAGEAKCSNITTCIWTGSDCEDNGIGDKGVQCADINNSQICNNIPMLATCCMWNGSVCQDAPFTTSCWDNMQEPPEGAKFCEDYNARNSKSTCEQIAGDPWYMPCEWDNQSNECRFAFDDMFGDPALGEDFGFNDIGSKSNCESMGGVWKSEKWTDPSGAIHTDEWCEMGFGIGFETCDSACWACEFQNNGSVWSSAEESRSACEQSAAQCIFHEDSYAFNHYGWCDMDWQMQGNCDQNCWDCWDSTKCSGSQAECKWFVDSHNDNVGWCDRKNVKTCSEDCYMCWDQNNCGNSDAGCTWDTAAWFCKPSGTGEGSSSEICFDGIDNDADNFIDCTDPECMFNDFCGGSNIFGSDCMSRPDNASCVSGEGNCVWITDQWGTSWCDMEGAQCWIYDDDETTCNDEPGCNYSTMEGMGKGGVFCDINQSLMDNASCWDFNDNITCNAEDDCEWGYDPWCAEYPEDPWCAGNTGMCEFKLWSCHKYDMNKTGCEADENCGWMTDWFNPEQGWCDPICFSLNETACGSNSYCSAMNASEMGMCQPEKMFTGCWNHLNEPECDVDNQTCVWVDDPFMGGFCADKFMHNMIGDMDKSPPHEIEREECNIFGEGEQSDICFLGIKDDPKTFGLSVGVSNMQQTAVCKNFVPPEDKGNFTAKFYWYLDTDNIHDGGCSAADNPSVDGFEFKFKYESMLLNEELVETKVAYKCSNGTWSPSMIKMTTWPDKMCHMVNGGVIAISKEDIDKLKVLNLFVKTADMRIYATTANDTGNDANVSDTIGPAWYSPGAADFKFEDCMGFTDQDGDGLLPADDPDCTNFFRKGYIDSETGLDCNDGIDNDGNGLVDCNDTGCMYDQYYCPAVVDDNTAPTITWLKKDVFTNGAFVGVNTDEPTNAVLYFYKNDSYCANISNAIQINDSKSENSFELDDYTIWHDFPVDQFYFNDREIDFNISTNNTYYYKLKVCDKSDNCALSACLSFTTKSNTSEFVIGFNLPPPSGNVTDLLGQLHVKFDFGTGNYSGSIENDKGLKINDTQGRDVNIKFTNPNSTNSWSIDLMGADLLKAQTLNISDSFIVNETSDNHTFVGMDKSKWKEMAQNLGVDYVIIEIPDGVSAGQNEKLVHCPDNITTLDDPRCIEVDLNDVNCTFTENTTTCRIPTSIGFTVFGVSGGLNYSLNFSGNNYVVFGAGGSNYTMVNVTNAENGIRKYNFSLVVSGSSLDYTINGSYPTWDLVEFTAYESININISFNSSVAGVRYVDLIATVWNDSLTDLNASEDMGAIVVNVTGGVNSPPSQPSLVSPTDGATTQNLTVILNVTVTDPDGDSMNVTFWNNATEQQIGNATNIANGSFANVTWSGLNYSTTYYWYVNSTDGEYTNKSNVWNFTTKDAPDNLPNVTLNLPPPNHYNDTSDPVNVTFNCSSTDDNGLINISLYITNSTNHSFALNQTTNITGVSNSSSWTLEIGSGNYTWNCLAYDSVSSSDWGDSNRTLNVNASSTEQNDSYEPDNNYTLANWIATDGTPQSHTFVPAGDVDWIKFNATENAKYIIQTSALGGGADTIIILYEQNGITNITENDDLESGLIKRSKIVWTATGTGTYFVEARDWNASHSGGRYNISIIELPDITLSILGNSSRGVQKGDLFNITLNVSCAGINCTDIEIYLDPEKQKPAKLQHSPQEDINLLNRLDSLPEGEYDVIIMLTDITAEELRESKSKIESRIAVQSISPKLEARRQAVDNRQTAVLSTLGVSPRQASTISTVSQEFTLKRKYNVINALSGRITKQGLEALENEPNVESVQLRRNLSIMLSDSVPQIKANDTWATQYKGVNITGEGQTICVLDTGINYNHSDFGGANGFPSAKVIGGYDFVNDDNDPWDDHGHGTHCAGTAASQDTTYKGVAPDAKIVAIKVMNASGSGDNSDIIAGIDWCVYHAEELNISVISMSLGGGSTHYQDHTTCDLGSLAKAVNYANDLGLTVTVAAGNEGWTDGVSYPACASGATTVSSIRKNDSTFDYNRGLLTNVLAPGYQIVATYYTGGYASMSGTSMATPHVAGAAALLNQYYRLHDGLDLHTEQIETALEESGATKYDSGSGLNFSRLDVLAALSEPIHKGIISTQIGATPFYTLDNNPNITSLGAGTSKLITWTINATGSYGTYDFFAFTDLDDGENEVLSNNVNISIVDNTYPLLNIEYPEADAVFNSSTVNFIFNVTDDFDDIFSCSLYIDGQINQTNSSVNEGISTNFTKSLEDENYLWYLNCTDAYGNCNVTAARNLTVDTTHPTFSDYKRTPNTPNEDQNVQVNVTLSEAADTVILEFNGTTNYTVNTNSGLEYYFTIINGTNYTARDTITYYWYANDSAGYMNKSTQQSFDVANQNPSITVTEPVGGDDNTTDTFTVIWTASDLDDEDVLNISCYADTDNGGYDISYQCFYMTANDNSQSCDMSAWTSGTYYIWCNVTDQYVNISVYSSGNITVDNTASVSDSPNDETYGQDTAQAITWTLSDNFAPGYYYITKNSTIQNQSTQWTNNTAINVWVNTSTLGDWNYTIFFNDSFGAQGIPNEVIITITDTTKPTFNDYKRSPATPTEEENTQVNVTLSETSHTVILEWNGTTNNTVTTNDSYEYYFTIINGTNYTAHDTITYYWYANDTAGNMNKSAQQSFTVANQNPSITVTEPADGDGNTTDTFTITWTASDLDDEDLLNISCYADTDSTGYDVTETCFYMTTDDNSESCDMSAWMSGTYYIWCNATDQYVNTSDYSQGNITVDNTPPISDSPDNASYGQDTAQNITWTLTDNFASGYYYITRNSIIQNQTAAWTNNTPVTIWVNTSTLGDWNYTIFFNDSLGTDGTSDEVLITINDITKPIFGSYQTSPAAPTEEQNVQANVTLSETPDTVILEWDGTTNHTVTTSNGLEYYFTIINGTNYTAHDTITYYWYANDTAGNMNKSAQQSFTVANQNPMISVTEPAGGDDSTTDTFTITWTASDLDDEDVLNISCYADTDSTGYDVTETCFYMTTDDNSQSCDMSAWTSGTYYIWCNATDQYVNISDYSQDNITVDNTPPISDSPTGGNYGQDTAQNITWTLTDNFEEGNYYVIRNTTIQNQTATWTNNTEITVWVNTSALGDWNYTIFFNDSLGTEGTPDEVIITINDMTKPIFGSYQTSPAAPTEEQNVQANVTLSETPDTLILEWDGTTNHTVTTSNGLEYYFTIINGTNYTAHDTITYYWYANDTAGNMNKSVQQSFTVANQNPIISVTEPAGGDDNTTDTVIITWTASDLDDEDLLNISCYADTDSTGYDVTETCFYMTTDDNSQSCDMSAWTSGTYYIWCNVTDQYVNTSDYSQGNITVDNTPPISDSPTGGSYGQDTAQNITWTLTDNFEEGDYYVIRNSTIQNQTATWTNNTEITIWVNTSTLGDWNYTIFFNDSLGTDGTPDEVIITINDMTKPTFSGHARNPNPPTEDQNVQVNATISETPDTVILEWNGTANHTVTTSSGLEYYFTIINGTNYTAHDTITYYWYANDTAGNMNKSVQQSFIVANQIPTVSAPALNNITPQTNDILNCTGGTFSDNDDEDSETTRYYRWYDSDSEIAGQISQTLDLSLAGLNKGDMINCSIKVFDGYDNSTWVNSSNTATIANTAPTILIQNTFINATDSHTFNVTAGVQDIDDSSDITATNISYSSGSCVNIANSTSGNYFNSTWNCSGTALVSTSIVIGFTDADSFYAETSSSSNTYPNQKPTITGVDVTPNGPVQLDDLTCTVTGYNDADLDTANYYYEWYNNSVKKFTFYTTAMTNILESGNTSDGETWNCTVIPADGYENGTVMSDSVTIGVNNPPTTTQNLPVDNYNTSSIQVTFNCSATDDNNLANIALYGNWNGWHLNETIPITGTSNSTIFAKNLSDGTYLWNCLSYDNNSQSDWANSNRTFTVDSTLPTSDSPNNTSYGQNTAQNITWTLTDNFASGYYYVTRNSIIQNQTAAWTNNTPVTIWVNTSTLGDWNYTIFFNDSLGTEGTPDEVIITITDITKPTFSSYQTSPAVPTEEQNVQANVTLSETPHTVILEWNGTTNYTVTTSNGLEYYFTIINGTNYTAHDTITYYWYANDTAGNMNKSAQQAFTVANQDPTITVIEPAGGDDNTTDIFTITWTASDLDDEDVLNISCYADTDNSGYDITETCFYMAANTGTLACDMYTWGSGTYYIWCNVTDQYVNISDYSSGSITVDNTVPVSDSPNDETYGQDTAQNITWTLSDNFAPGYYYITKNNSIQNQSTQWTNDTAINVWVNTSTFGDWNYTIFYNDSLWTQGVPNEVIITITDTIKPIFNDYKTSPAAPTEEQNVQVNVTLSETPDTVILELDGTTNHTVTTSNGLEYYFTIINGTNYTAHDTITYYWYANDTAGNMNKSAQQSFTVANQIPTVSAPGLNSTVPQTNDILNCTGGTFSDNDDEDSETTRYYRWYDSDSEIAGQTSQTLNLSLAGLNKGDMINCSIKVFDGYDNSTWVNSSNTATITNTAPTTSAPNLNPTTIYKTTAQVTCNNASVSDADEDTVTWYYQWYVNDVKTITTQAISNSSYSKGDELICEIFASDTETNSTKYNSSSAAVLNLAPSQPTLNSPQSGATNQDPTLILNVTVTDPDTDTMNVTFWNNATGQQIGNTTNIADGNHANITWSNLNYSTTYSWYANTTDGQYTIKSSVWYFTTKSPSFLVTLNSPDTQTATNDDTPDFNFTVSGTGNTYNCTLYMNGTNKGSNETVSNNTATAITSTTLTDGNHAWYINCTLAGAASYSETRTLTVDATSPVITILLPGTQSNYSTQAVSFNITLDGSGSWCGYSLDGAVNKTMTNTAGNWGDINSSMVEGSHTVQFFCNDTAGNMANTTERTFTIDVTTPTFNPPSSLNNSRTNTDITLSATDSGTGVATVKYSVNGSANVTSTIVSLSSLAENITTIIDAYVTDYAGNINHTEYTFTKDTTPPAITINLPVNETELTTNNTELNYTISELPHTMWYLIDNLEGTLDNTTLSDNLTINFTYIAGKHTLYLYANDSTGNIGTEIVDIKLNRQLNMSNYTQALENSTEATVNITGNISGPITTNESVWVNQTLNMTLNITDTIVKLKNFQGLDADWQEFFEMNSTNTTIQTRIQGYGTKAGKMVYLGRVNKFLGNKKYNGTVTFSPYNSSAYTEIMYCPDDDAITCTIIGACINDTFNGTACYTDKSTNITVHVPHFSSIILGNDTIAPQITIDAPTDTETNGFDIGINLTVTEDTDTCNYSLNYSALTNITMTKINATHFTSTVSAFLPNSDYALNITCTDANNNTNTTNKMFTLSDNIKPTLSTPSVSKTTSSATITWTTDEKTDAIVNYSTISSLGTNLSISENATSHSVTISALSSSTLYYYNITSCDLTGNCNTTGTHILTTDASTGGDDGSSTTSSGPGGGPVMLPQSEEDPEEDEIPVSEDVAEDDTPDESETDEKQEDSTLLKQEVEQLILLLEQEITAAQSQNHILQKEITDKLENAKSAFNAGDYANAKQQASEALKMIEQAKLDAENNTENGKIRMSSLYYLVIAVIIIVLVLAIRYRKRKRYTPHPLIKKGTSKAQQQHKIRELENYLDKIRPIISKLRREGRLNEKYETRLREINVQKNEAKKMLNKDNAHTDEQIKVTVNALIKLKKDIENNGSEPNAEVFDINIEINNILKSISETKPLLDAEKDASISIDANNKMHEISRQIEKAKELINAGKVQGAAKNIKKANRLLKSIKEELSDTS